MNQRLVGLDAKLEKRIMLKHSFSRLFLTNNQNTGRGRPAVTAHQQSLFLAVLMAKGLFQKGFECGCRGSFTTTFIKTGSLYFTGQRRGRQKIYRKGSVVTAMMFKGYWGGKIRREKQILLVG